MEYQIKQDPRYGRMLWLTDGETELGIPLDFGIRILHVSACGGENLLYQQPEDLSDGLTTGEGWRIWGGHRLWSAPESEQSCWPDNQPVSYTMQTDGVILTQAVDPWLHQRKQLQIRFCPDGSLLLEHRIENTGSEPVSIASWGVSTFSGGKAELWFDGGTKHCLNPERILSVWGDADLSDLRLRFTRDRIFAAFGPGEALKIGIFSHSGKAVLQHKNQQFTLTFEADSAKQYPDGGCNFELYTDSHIFELEALGPVQTLAPGQAAAHWERWTVKHLGKDAF